MTLDLIAAADNSPLDASPRQLLILGGVLVGLVLLSLAMRKKTGGPSARQYRREIDGAVREEQQVHADIEDLLKELEQLSRRLSTQIDEGVARLNRAIADADQRIKKLNGNPGTATPIAQPATQPSIPEPTEPRTRQIYVLADEGLAAPEIAKRLNRHLGEVELILNLRRAAGAPPAA